MSLLKYSSQPLVIDNRFVELSTLLATLSKAQMKERLAGQEAAYLAALCNKSAELEHYEVCAVIVDLLEEKIDAVEAEPQPI